MKPDTQLSQLGGNTEGRLLVVETVFARSARRISLTDLQRELVIGSLLGDGYLMPTTAGSCLRVNHGVHQRAYVDWKFGLLAELVRTAPRACGRSYYFRTITHPDLTRYRAAFYASGSKTVPIEVLEREMTAFGLAIWFMDDGCFDGRRLRINTQGFSYYENLLLVTFLQAKFGIVTRLNRDKNRYRLRVSEQSRGRFIGLVRTHLIPSMLYKLPP